MKLQSIVEQKYEPIFKTSLVLNIEEKTTFKNSSMATESLHGSKKSN